MIKHIELINKEGKTLRGYLDYPENMNGELIVFFHGLTGNKSEHAKHFVNFSRMISKEGFASLRIDFSGNGESDGEFVDFTMDTLMSDAQTIIDYAFTIEGAKKITLLGFSMGGAVATYMSGIYKEKISKLVLWSPATKINENIRKHYENQTKAEEGKMPGTFEISDQMAESTTKYNITENAHLFTNPVLIINGKKDLSVNYMDSVRLSVTFHNSRLHLVNESGHGYDKNEQRDELYRISREFLLENK